MYGFPAVNVPPYRKIEGKNYTLQGTYNDEILKMQRNRVKDLAAQKGLDTKEFPIPTGVALYIEYRPGMGGKFKAKGVNGTMRHTKLGRSRDLKGRSHEPWEKKLKRTKVWVSAHKMVRKHKRIGVKGHWRHL
jgi:hypothetical protein